MDDSLCLCSSLKAAAACCERELNDALSEFDISHCQAMILQKIAEGKISMSTMSKEMCCHKSNVTQVVSGLEKKELITRSLQENDRRVSSLVLTRKGAVAHAELKGLLGVRAKECMNVFTPVERRTLSELLKKYVEKHRMS
ncbi:MarR family transcriptional regulator [Candidatus Peribacteria bacterium]|nr:MarR family transcriptional regulator [Candidatus Peribacteria bacterium]